MFLDAHIKSLKLKVPDFYYHFADIYKIQCELLRKNFTNNYSENNFNYLKNQFSEFRPNVILGEAGTNPEFHKAFREILEITNAESILEIGFNTGGSSLAWLLNGVKFIWSIDKYKCPEADNFISNYFSGRFKFTNINSREIQRDTFNNRKFDLIFVDGEHNKDAVFNDTFRSLWFHPKYILFDDTHSNQVRDGINIFKNKLIHIKDYGEIPKMSLYKVNPELVTPENCTFQV